MTGLANAKHGRESSPQQRVPMTKPATSPILVNRLLARLPAPEYQRLLPLLRPVPLEFKQILNEPASRIANVYFPNHGVISEVIIMENGTGIEVATVGNEGMAGLNAVLGAQESPNRMIVQVRGGALRMAADDFRAEISRDCSLRQLLVRYHTAFLKQISQSVACNGLHPVKQRCCRWILETHNRVQSAEFPLTHEFLSQMLGVRRMSITAVLRPLQTAGLIRARRGRITVLDRLGLEAAACECYHSVRATFDRLIGEPDHRPDR
jgi:CRP-like cAMP-binding protein